VLTHLAHRPINGDPGHFLDQESGTLRLLSQAVRGQGRIEEAETLMISASHSSREEQLQARKEVYGFTIP
jgi:hypothetical protein